MFDSYEVATLVTKLEALEQRRTQLCTHFLLKSPKNKHWFAKTDPDGPAIRNYKPNFKTPLFRFRKSPIPCLTGLLNFF